MFNNTGATIWGGEYGVVVTDAYVTNAGTISGLTRSGVRFYSGGRVDNASIGIIGGGNNGVHISNDTGYVNNNGIIAGTNRAGVRLDYGGNVFNNGGATIWGGQYGVEISGAPGYVTNASTISALTRSGVRFRDGGNVDNIGTIGGGDNGVHVSGGTDPSFVYNTGVIAGTNGAGVRLDYGGNVFNSSGATIWGGQYGVEISGAPGYVTNAGTISALTRSGVRIRDGGSVDNGIAGIIAGGDNGVHLSGYTPGGTYVNNFGVITGTNGAGVKLDDGGVVNNTGTGYEPLISGSSNPGSIEGGQYGVEASGGNANVYNESGSIIGDTRAGVRLRAGGYVYNDYASSIWGGTEGVKISGGSGEVENFGLITGNTRDGVEMQDGGTVYNYDGASITGGRYGVEISSNSGDVYNEYEASITGNGRAGVRLRAGGDVYNEYDSSIWGNTEGVKISGASGYVYNYSSSITGNTRAGVDMQAGGEVDNYSGISGGTYGVEIGGGTGSVYNEYDASITGNGRSGVRLRDGGNVYNEDYSSIWGSTEGVKISGNPGYLLNYEHSSVTGNTGAGVEMDNGGVVINKWESSIQGATDGVLISGNTGYVTNGDTITGGTGAGVDLQAGGTVLNKKRHSDITGNIGVQITGGAGNVDNYGTITGTGGTAISLGTYNDTVTLESRSHTYGNIEGGGGSDTAYLIGHGEYDGSFLDFSQLYVDASNRGRGWNLTGNNVFSNSVDVESGILRNNGTLTSYMVTVDDGARFGGTGTIIGNLQNLSGGLLTPGNPIGTITVLGNMTNWGDYYVQIDDLATNSDKILVSGTAKLNGGEVIVPIERKIYGNEDYLILAATNGVIGQFDGSEFTYCSPISIFLSTVLVYSNNAPYDVYLGMRRASFASVADTFNENSVGHALDPVADWARFGNAPGMSNLVSELLWIDSAADARKALDSMSGEIHGSMGLLSVLQQGAFNNTMAQRTGRISVGGGSGEFATSWKPVLLASAGSTPPPMPEQQVNQPFDLWMQGIGSFGQLKNDGNATGGNYTISGMSGGMDYRVSPKLLLGLGVGYSHDNAGVGGPGANGTVDAYQIGGYGGYVSGPWHLDSILSYGFLNTSTKRFINVGSIHQEADGSYDGSVFSMSAEGGYAFKFDWLTVEPTVGLDYAHLFQGGFAETGTASDGNNYGLNVKRVNMDSFRSELGVRLAAQFGKPDGVRFIPALNGVWKHEFADRYADLNASFVGGSGDFVVRGVELGADTAVVGAGLTVEFNKTVQGFANYNANLNSKNESSTISGGLSISW